MPVNVVLGGQWGDEGKGKIVDTLCQNVSIVARFQGGANAGHTIYFKGQKVVLHQLPSGILKEDALCLMGHGMVIDPVGLREEMAQLKEVGIKYENRIKISPYATIITPWHKKHDQLQENNKSGEKKIGTTGKGIGPAYADHVNRRSLKAYRLTDRKYLQKFLLDYIEMLKKRYNPDDDELNSIRKQEDDFLSAAKDISRMVEDFSEELHQTLEKGENVLIEGAQGLLLDINFGTYPYVTSSSTGSAGIMAGLPLSWNDINNVSGIFKAYTTRVGNGPFPTELFDATGELLRDKGFEYGATTGRPRRCGWFDAVLAKYSIRLNGISELIMTKIDVLNDFEEIKVAVAYEIDGVKKSSAYGIMHRLDEVKPIYESFPGWQSDVSGIKKYMDLPQKLKNYVKFIEDYTSASVRMISTGVNREDVIIR